MESKRNTYILAKFDVSGIQQYIFATNRLKENVASVDIKLSADDLRIIGDSLAEIEIYGDRFPENIEKGTGI